MTTRYRYLAAMVLTPLFLLAACGMDDAVERQRFRVTIEHIGTVYPYFESGAFYLPVGETDAGPAFPGGAFEFTLHAAPGHRVSFATMFGQSNDLFFAPDGDGIALYDDEGNPISGDVTDQVYLWDAGTEANQEPGTGVDQAPRQSAVDTGAADPNTAVRMATDDYGNLPAVAEVLAVTLSHEGEDTFTVRIENVSDMDTLVYMGGSSAVPLSPGAWVVHSAAAPLFTVGAADRGEGLEHLAEDGDPSTLASTLAASTGLTTPYAPGLWDVSTDQGALFDEGAADRGEGLEALAEDGDPSILAMHLGGNSGVFNTPEGADEPGPLFPGEKFVFEIEARPGERLFLATMFGQSNDVFAGTGDMGVALFDERGEPRNGEITDALDLWDTGTEVNQRPGTGSDQAPRQAAADTGADEHGTVHRVNDGYAYPSLSSQLRVTLTPIQ